MSTRQEEGGKRVITMAKATAAFREEFLEMMLDQLGRDSRSALEFLGLSSDQFADLYRATGEVRVVQESARVAGGIWIEHRGRELHVHGMILRPQMRGRGIGSALFRRLEDEYADQADWIELGAQTSNEDALRFYRRIGFQMLDEDTAPGFAVLRKMLSDSPESTANA